MKPPEFIRSVASPENEVYWGTYGCVVTLTLALGSAIVLWRVCLERIVQDLLDKLRDVPYRGEKAVWDIAKSEMISSLGRELLVYTADGYLFQGHAEEVPTLVTDRDIYLNVYNYRKVLEDGSTSQPAKPAREAIAFIPFANVTKILLLRPLKVSEQVVVQDEEKPVDTEVVTEERASDRSSDGYRGVFCSGRLVVP